MFLSFPSQKVATIAFNMAWRRGPYGGGNQWLGQTKAAMARAGYQTVFQLSSDTDCVLGTHAGLGGNLSFSYEEVLRAREKNPNLRCIQRINDNDIRKGTTAMDAHLAECNRAADHTVFVSRWLRDYHASKWFDANRPHSIIYNGADPSAFHPLGANHWEPNRPLRLVTHHWSDNPSKGFDFYQQLDEQIASGSLKNVELWIIGRWPSAIRWRSARTFEACAGRKLADLLRQCHVAVTASRHEPGAMHPVESMQCGLPLLYTSDTGGTVELGEKFGVLVQSDLKATLEEVRSRYSELRERILNEAPSGDLMCLSYRRLVQQLLSDR